MYDVYATQLAKLTLHSCQDAGGNADPLKPCGPTALIQDSGRYSTVQSLEQDAEQQIASLRGIANDTTNVYFSRGEIRASMFLDLLSRINRCAQGLSTCSTADQGVVQYYAHAVKQKRVDVAQLADELYEGRGTGGDVDGTFCIPGATSCGSALVEAQSGSAS